MKNKSMIWEIIKKELRDVIRDKKTLITMILVPMLLYPAMIFFMFSMEEAALDEENIQYGTIGIAFEMDDTLETLVEEAEMQIEKGTQEELQTKLENGEIDTYITLDDKKFTIYYEMKSDILGNISVQVVNDILESYKHTIQSHMLTSEGLIPEDIFEVYTIEQKDISGQDFMSQYMLNMLPSMMFIIAAVTATMVVIDMTAGEKERGTLETLLTFPITNRDIITGKFLAASTCTAISAIISFSSMYAVIYYYTTISELFAGVQLLSVQNLVLSIIVFVLYSMLICAISIVLASGKKTFKEAQSATNPISIVAMIPMFLVMMGTKLNITLACIPFINVTLLVNDIMANTVNIQYLLITIVSNIVFIVIALNAIAKLYKSDKILFS